MNFIFRALDNPLWFAVCFSNRQTDRLRHWLYLACSTLYYPEKQINTANYASDSNTHSASVYGFLRDFAATENAIFLLIFKKCYNVI